MHVSSSTIKRTNQKKKKKEKKQNIQLSLFDSRSFQTILDIDSRSFNIHYYRVVQSRFSLSPVSQRTPERRAKELDERSQAHQETALAGVHAHLLEVDSHQGEKGAKGRIEEEVEALHGEHFLIDRAEQVLDHVALAADLVRRLLRLRIQVRIDLSLGLGIDHGPGTWHLRQRSASTIAGPIIVIFVSIVLHDWSRGLASLSSDSSLFALSDDTRIESNRIGGEIDDQQGVSTIL